MPSSPTLRPHRPAPLRALSLCAALVLPLALALLVGCKKNPPNQFVQAEHPEGWFRLDTPPNWSAPLMLSEPAGLYLNVCRMEYRPDGETRGGMVMLRLANAHGHLSLDAAAARYQDLQGEAATDSAPIRVAGQPAIRFRTLAARAGGAGDTTPVRLVGTHDLVMVGPDLYIIDILCDADHAARLEADTDVLLRYLTFYPRPIVEPTATDSAVP